MKKLLYMSMLTGLFLVTFSCGDDFLQKNPQGALSINVLANSAGVEGLLIGAYSLLDGWEGGWSTAGGAPWNSAASNWVYGDVYSDDAYKGTEAGDQPALELIESYNVDAANPYLIGRWARLFDGIARANDVLRVVPQADDIPADEKAIIVAEAKFLRAHYHFEVQRLWDNIPYITDDLEDTRVTNDGPKWDEIEADFQAAVADLPVEPRNGQVGRANKMVATAYLGKVQLYQQKYGDALNNFNTVINSGRYALHENFHTNFRLAGNNGIESIFQIQASVNDGSGGQNGNMGDQLNHLQGGPGGGCCGFHQPSQNLVNRYKTEDGLPTEDFNATDLKNDDGVLAGEPFEPTTEPIDPRLDYTVGRRGIPYLDWGVHPGAAWVRNQAYAGPYSQIKKMYYQSEQGTGSDTQAGWHGAGLTALNHNIIRYADVLLMAAECEVEVGSVDQAIEYVNMIRRRAANESTWVKDADGNNAANYQISEYPSGLSQADARDAVRIERRLELAMEGHRFFDLKRWGVAESTINTYLDEAKTKRTYLTNAVFQPKNIRMPIPQQAIDQSNDDAGMPTLTQNPGF
ncbi:RagB/SusD family nutrient uptake outer membrane protein [Portibacter marinus]|uniref:RagB/SusD family nutrient uptake outer membrane protein n=1 Tax=Portibacter marinus TaxID=2898660 RepID=UPI001F1B14AE|nr:RagB/SusD family nutrient uptake outer membrane protein [Portibacter marinus]